MYKKKEKCKQIPKISKNRMVLHTHVILKGKTGLTLITLIVTIIIMLILAGITLQAVIPEDGLIRKAVNAIDLTNKNEIIENIKFAIISAQRAGLGTINEDALNQGLTDKFGTNGYELEGNKFDGWTVTIPDKKVSYVIDVNGNVTEVEFEEKIDNTGSLVLGFVDDLGTRATIYLYGNSDKIKSGQITITMPDGTTKDINALEDNTEISGDANYATYTVAKNGDYTFKAKAGTAETETIIRVKNIEKFKKIDDLGYKYANSEKRAYAYNGAAIPKGYYVDEKTNVSTGLVITDEIDAEGYSTGNEWVWVPVNSAVGNDDFYYEGTGIVAGTENVTFSKYSKLWDFSTNPETNVTTKNVKSEVSPLQEQGYREPALLTDETYGESKYYNSINNRITLEPCESVEEVANQYIADYNNMVNSVEKYKGFYIGRYEITESNKNWYYFYNKCMTLEKENTESGMVYGTLWDATMQWLAKCNYSVGYNGKQLCGFGIYSFETITLKQLILVREKGPRALKTGQTSYTKSNNIYDLAGNKGECTQEATTQCYRTVRGGRSWDGNLTYTYAGSRS